MSSYSALTRLKTLFNGVTPSTRSTGLLQRSNVPKPSAIRPNRPPLTRKWLKFSATTLPKAPGRSPSPAQIWSRDFSSGRLPKDFQVTSLHERISPSQILDIVGREGVHSSVLRSISSSESFEAPMALSMYLVTSVLAGVALAIVVVSYGSEPAYAESDEGGLEGSKVKVSISLPVDVVSGDGKSEEEVLEEAREEVRTRFWPVLMKEWKMLLLAIVLTLATSVAELYSMKLGGGVIDSALSKNLEKFMASAWKLCGAVAVQGLLQFVSYAVLTQATERVRARLSSMVFESVIYQDKAFFDRHNSAELMQRLSQDVQNIRDVVKHCISLGVKSSTSIVGGMLAAWSKSPTLTLLIAAAIGTAVSVGSLYARLLRRLSRQSKDAASKAISAATEATSAVSTVQAFVGEEREIARHNAHLRLSVLKSQQFGAALGFFKGISTAGVSGILVGVLLYGGHLVQIGRLSVGDLSSFLVVASSIQNSLGHIAQLIGQVSHGRDAVQRVFAIIDETPKINPKRAPHSLPILLASSSAMTNILTNSNSESEMQPKHSKSGTVTLDNVCFAYDNRPDTLVLNHVNITLEAGKTLSLVGHSGSGKTTISKLLLRFYDPISGCVTLDGVDIKTLDPHWLRSQVGIVEQEPVLFGGTIWENIAYGRPDATREEIIEAARSANCVDFIASFPDGYDTLVGERGAQLSGGQKQRIAIARAILKNPRILILDEATSALDATTETQVQDALNNLMKNRTTLIIAHRLSTIKNSDRIVVIDHGRVVEVGDHESLSKSGGYYSKLIDQQRLSGRTHNILS